METLDDNVPILENGSETDIDPTQDKVEATKPSIEKEEMNHDEKTQDKQEELTQEKKNDLIYNKDDLERKEEENKQTDGIKDEPERKGEESKEFKENEKENEKEMSGIKQEADNGENMEIEPVKIQEPKVPVGKKRGPKKKSLDVPIRSPRKPANIVSNIGCDIPVPEGWSRVVTQRINGASAGKFDVYYFSPIGKKLRSKNEVRAHCEKNDVEVDIDMLVFSQKAPGSQVRAARSAPNTPKSPKITSAKTPKTPKVPKTPKAPKIPKATKSEPTKKRKIAGNTEGKGQGKKATFKAKDKPKVKAKAKPKGKAKAKPKAKAKAKAKGGSRASSQATRKSCIRTSTKDSGKMTVKFTFSGRRAAKTSAISGPPAKRSRR